MTMEPMMTMEYLQRQQKQANDEDRILQSQLVRRKRPGIALPSCSAVAVRDDGGVLGLGRGGGRSRR